MFLGLLLIFMLVMLLPFTVPFIEKNLEYFLFIMGILAAIVGGMYSAELFLKAASDPINITIAVLIAGLIFKWLQLPLEKIIRKTSKAIPFPLFTASLVIILGLLSSIITAIIAALVLILIVSTLKLDRNSEVRLIIISCFSIGIGAALTPIGEPLSTIAVNKLNGDFFLLFSLIGPQVLTAICLFALSAIIFVKPPAEGKSSFSKKPAAETYEEILVRAIKIYFFVMGLTFLGAGFEPIINRFLLDVDPLLLYWINIISALLDNATLAAAEISPAMDHYTVQMILLGLLLSGGMLIPGNIPNIISASKLQITSKEWAKFAVPFGLFVMLIYYFFALFTHL